MIEPKELMQNIALRLNEKKALDVSVIDISPKASFADYLLLASAANDRQVTGLVEYIEDLLEPQGIFPRNVEGSKNSGWILMDYGDVVVNILTLEMREKYDIETIWGDCELTKIN